MFAPHIRKSLILQGAMLESYFAKFSMEVCGIWTRIKHKNSDGIITGEFFIVVLILGLLYRTLVMRFRSGFERSHLAGRGSREFEVAGTLCWKWRCFSEVSAHPAGGLKGRVLGTLRVCVRQISSS